jgi:hypothetical protein
MPHLALMYRLQHFGEHGANTSRIYASDEVVSMRVVQPVSNTNS